MYEFRTKNKKSKPGVEDLEFRRDFIPSKERELTGGLMMVIMPTPSVPTSKTVRPFPLLPIVRVSVWPTTKLFEVTGRVRNYDLDAII